LAALKTVSLSNYQAVMDYPGIAMRCGTASSSPSRLATAVMILSAIIGWLVLRTRIPGRWILDNIAVAAHGDAGPRHRVAIMVSYLALGRRALRHDLDTVDRLYGRAFLPYGMRFNTASLLQPSQGTEESRASVRRELPHHIPAHRAAAAQTGPDRGLDLHRHRSIRELSSSVLPSAQIPRVSVVLWEMWQNGQYVQLSALGVMLIAALLSSCSRRRPSAGASASAKSEPC